MRKKTAKACCLATLMLSPTAPAWAVAPSPQELAMAKTWTGSHLTAKATTYPFSFMYDGQPSASLLKTWNIKQATKKLGAGRTERTVTYTDPKTGLRLRCVAVEYGDYPTVEWTLYLKNTGAVDTPIISDIKAIDTAFERANAEFLLHYNTGDNCSPNSYEPHVETFGPGVSKHLASAGGNPTTGVLPYFNVEHSNGGVIVAIGWGGQWSADFIGTEGKGLRITGGQELTHFRLHPGEEVRTPMAVLQFYKGDYLRSQNIWRRWMLAHNVPKGWKPVVWSNSDGALVTQFSETTEMRALDQFEKARVKLDVFEIDAGWYPDNGAWQYTGTWEPDPVKFPRGIRPVSDKAHSLGMELMLWFEPERVTQGTWLYENHSEWLLGGTLLDMGNKDARTWAINHIDKLITEQGVDIYRQDFNMSPLSYWRNNDAPDRQGITEINHVVGLQAYWDELKRRHPKLRFDSCASGGRRSDLETLRRAVVLMRSDYWEEPVGNQCFTGFTQWCPYFGTGSAYADEYKLLSKSSAIMGIGHDTSRENVDWDVFKHRVAQGRKCQEYILGDFYPLTPYTLDNNVWIAWQYDCPEKGGGIVQAFRRAECPDSSFVVKMLGLEPKAKYEVTDMDGKNPQRFTGSELMDKGLAVKTDSKPDALLMTYKKVGKSK